MEKTVAYEAVLLLDATYNTEQVQGVIDKYVNVLKENGGIVTDIDRWDTRRLAYEIKRKREANYVIINFTSTAATRDELHRIIRISDDVLRAMIIKQDPKADKNPSRARVAEMERRERDSAARASITAAPVVAEPITDLSAPSGSAGVSEEGDEEANETAEPTELAEGAETSETE